MFCARCGAQLPDNAKFCGECGATIKKENEKISEAKPGMKAIEPKKKLQEQSAKGIATAPTPETKDDGGIVRPMKILFGMVGGFALLFFSMDGLHELQRTQQPTQQQTQQQSKRVTTEEKLGLKFYDFKVDTMPEVDIKKEGSSLVGISCMIENVSQDTVGLYTIDFFLRKKGQNTFQTIWTNSGFTKSLTADNTRRRSVGVSFESNMDLFPGDKTHAVFTFDTNIMGGDITGWVLCMEYYEDSKEKLFPIVKF